MWLVPQHQHQKQEKDLSTPTTIGTMMEITSSGTVKANRNLVVNGNALSEAAVKLKLHKNIILSIEEEERGEEGLVISSSSFFL